MVAAAGLSGLAQASYLAGGVDSAPPALRFGIGAWPAIAAAIVAHLLFLLHTPEPRPDGKQPDAQAPPQQPALPPAVVQPARLVHSPVVQPPPVVQVVQATPRVGSPAKDKASAAARRHVQHHGQLPSVSQLMAAAGVARGTAGTVLKALREDETFRSLRS